MYYVKNSLGEEIPVTNTNVFTHCPKCGVEHKADLVSLIIEHGEDCTGDILDSSMHCEECSKAHLPMYERMDEIEFVASRFPGTSVVRWRRLFGTVWIAASPSIPRSWAQSWRLQ